MPQATPPPKPAVPSTQTHIGVSSQMPIATPKPVTRPVPAQAPPTHIGTGSVAVQQPPSSMWNVPSRATTGTHGVTAPPTSDPQPPSDVVAAGIGLEAGARINHYELIRELGRGGMGIVFAARDTKLGRRVAIKFLLNATQAVKDRFTIEARATAKFSHENIVTIYEVNEVDNMPFMVLEFLEGQMLRNVMGAFGGGTTIAPSRVVELTLPIARALARAHEEGIVHRDLKPENVFVTSAGQVKVLDFGIAKPINMREAQNKLNQTVMANEPMNLTREGALVGTLPYMSPEQMGMGEVDARSDIWAVGIIMFEMLIGRHPIYPLTTDALITNAISDDPMPSLQEAAPGVPEALVALVTGCLRKRVQERIPTANEIVRRLEDMAPGRQGRQLAEGESPYPGLTAFQENDANRFFGRGRDIARMVARIRELPITGIVGPSGVGKSSFIRAGVGPSLKAAGEHWDVVTLRPGRQPLNALASVVQKLTTKTGTDVQKQMVEHAQTIYRLRTEPGYVGTLLRARARQSNGHILLFIDQFEELYTLVPDLEERRAFTAAIAAVADDTSAPLRVVVSMRSDFLDRIGEDPRFMEELSKGLVFLQPPDRPGLREALVSPIEMVGHRFENPAMIEEMLDALGNMPGALPLLQFAASKLWDARDRQRRLLTVASYQAIGGISGALATHADDVVAQMNTSAQKLTQRIFRRLVTPERTRAIVELADLYQLVPDQTEVKRIIDLLVAARLLVVQTRGDAGGGSAEIVHESLIDRWPTLRRWLDEDQEDAAFIAQLAAAAKQWEAKGHPSGLLWRGDAMEEAKRWFNQRPRELTPRDRAFLDAVFALARRGKRTKRALLTVTFVVLGGGAAAASVAAIQIQSAKQEAEAEKGKAETEMKTAKLALAERDKKEAERIAAEKKQKDAEAAKAGLEQDKHNLQTANDDLEKRSKAQLEEDMKKLQAEKNAADVARAQAEKSAAIALKAKDAVDQVNAQLKAKLDDAKKLTTHLK